MDLFKRVTHVTHHYTYTKPFLNEVRSLHYPPSSARPSSGLSSGTEENLHPMFRFPFGRGRDRSIRSVRNTEEPQGLTGLILKKPDTRHALGAKVAGAAQIRALQSAHQENGQVDLFQPLFGGVPP